MILRPTKTGDVKTDKALDEIREELRVKKAVVRAYWWASNDLSTASGDRYMTPGWTGVSNVERGLIPMTASGRLRRLAVNQVTAGTGAATLSFVLRVNKKDTLIEVSFPNTSTGVFISKMDLEVPVKAGDEVGICVRKTAVLTAASTAVVASLEFVED